MAQEAVLPPGPQRVNSKWKPIAFGKHFAKLLFVGNNNFTMNDHPHNPKNVKGVGPLGPKETMLEFVAIILPGIVFAFAAERLMKRRLDTHYFVFLAAFHILALNFAALVLRNIIADFLSTDGYVLASGNMDYAEALLKQSLYAILTGIPLCLVEAFIGRYISVSLDDTKKEDENQNA